MALAVTGDLETRLSLRACHLAQRSSIARLVLARFSFCERSTRIRHRTVEVSDSRLLLRDRQCDSLDVLIQRQLSGRESLQQRRCVAELLEGAMMPTGDCREMILAFGRFAWSLMRGFLRMRDRAFRSVELGADRRGGACSRSPCRFGVHKCAA